MMRYKLIVYLVFFNLTFVFCQADTINIQVIAKAYEQNGIKIKWSLGDALIWQESITKGFYLERASKSENPLIFKKLNDGKVIKKWSKNQWEKYKSTTDSNKNGDFKYIEFAQVLSVEEMYLDGTESFEEVLKYKSVLEDSYMFASIAGAFSWEATVLQGLGFWDKSVTYGETYIYRITPAFKPDNYMVLPNEIEIINKVKTSNELEKIQVREKDSSIGLTWKEVKNTFGVSVEVSKDGKSYKRDKAYPFIRLNPNLDFKNDTSHYEVDSLINFEKYYFKIFAKTPFGDELLIGTASGTPKDLSPPNKPILRNIDHAKPNLVIISWELNEPISDDLAGFVIGRSTEEFGQYYQIHEGLVPADWRTFGDAYFNPDTSNFYIIDAVDVNGNRSRSTSGYLTLTDSIPPAPPTKVKGVMDSLGIVTLEVEPQTEKDFMGYRVYKANAEDHEFSVVQETYNDSIVEIARNPIIIDTSTLESLTPFVYYKIGALDYHYNESPPSEIIKVPRPDKYPPVPPMINDYRVEEGKVIFKIIASTSADTKQNYIYRKKMTSKEWVLLDSIGLQSSTLVDSTLQSSIYYEYGGKAVDESGLISEIGNIVKISTYTKPGPVKMNVDCKYFSKSGDVMLEWMIDQEIDGDGLWLTIYEKSSGEEDKFRGRLKTKQSDLLIYPAEISPTLLTIKGTSKKKEYLVKNINTCREVLSDISSDLKYIEYKKNKVND